MMYKNVVEISSDISPSHHPRPLHHYRRVSCFFPAKQQLTRQLDSHRHHHQILQQQVQEEEMALTEDHLSSVNLIHFVHEWMQVDPRDQAVGKRVMPLCLLPHLRLVVVAAAGAVPLLQADEGAEGAEEHAQMKVAAAVVAVVVAEEEEEKKEKNPRMKVEGVAKH
jgi:hypothetical protein